jgi:hypothetical protein
VQNRQLPQCSKSKRYLYITACSLTVGTPSQALPNQHSQLKLQCSLASTPPSGQSIKMRASGTLAWFKNTSASSEHQISVLVATSQPAPLKTASIASAMSRGPHCSESILPALNTPASYGRRLARPAPSHHTQKTTRLPQGRPPSHTG